jgi:hypothetical protein
MPKKLPGKLTASQERALINQIWSLLLDGLSDEEVKNSLHLDRDQYDEYKWKTYDLGGQKLKGKPVEHVYANYVLEQCKCIRDLNRIMSQFETNRQPSAFVSAVKARSEIQDKIIKYGQELGIIKTSKGGGLADINLTEMSNKELQALLTRELTQLDSMAKKYQNVDISHVETGEIHRGPALQIEEEKKVANYTNLAKIEKTPQRASNKVHKGRRVVKERIM